MCPIFAADSIARTASRSASAETVAAAPFKGVGSQSGEYRIHVLDGSLNVRDSDGVGDIANSRRKAFIVAECLLISRH